MKCICICTGLISSYLNNATCAGVLDDELKFNYIVCNRGFLRLPFWVMVCVVWIKGSFWIEQA